MSLSTNWKNIQKYICIVLIVLVWDDFRDVYHYKTDNAGPFGKIILTFWKRRVYEL